MPPGTAMAGPCGAHAQHVNVVLNLDAACDTSGSKVVLVDDASGTGLKLVATEARLFARLLAQHAGRLRVVKLKGPVREADVEAFVPALEAALGAEGALQLESLACKAATLDAAAAQRLAEVARRCLPADALLLPRKKAEHRAGDIAGLGAAAYAALFAPAGPPAAPASAPAPAPAVKAKLKVSDLTLLSDAKALGALAAASTVQGLPLPAVDQLKARGAISEAAAQALACALCALPAVSTFKLARYYWPLVSAAGTDDATPVGSCAHVVLATGLVCALRLAGRGSATIKLELKSKAVGKVAVTITSSSSVGDVAALLLKYGAVAPGELPSAP